MATSQSKFRVDFWRVWYLKQLVRIPISQIMAEATTIEYKVLSILSRWNAISGLILHSNWCWASLQDKRLVSLPGTLHNLVRIPPLRWRWSARRTCSWLNDWSSGRLLLFQKWRRWFTQQARIARNKNNFDRNNRRGRLHVDVKRDYFYSDFKESMPWPKDCQFVHAYWRDSNFRGLHDIWPNRLVRSSTCCSRDAIWRIG